MNASCYKLNHLGFFSFFLGFLVVSMGLSLIATPALAQSSSGSISGVVTDPSGAAIAGAEVKLVDVGTNTSQPTNTNAEGRYSFISVPPGVYNVTVGNPGFTPGNGYGGSNASGGTPTGVIPTTIESIEEFKIGTSNQTAEFNNAAGSQVSMVTKRGTNAFHGSLYEFYFGANVGAANLWRNNHVPSNGLPYTPLPATHRNRYGVSVGGPMTQKFWGGGTNLFYTFVANPFSNIDNCYHRI